ncbi:type II toxin-antitoxin system RelE/ParE family toxin [Endothiovibrio diazotrophicus]
MKRCSVVWLRRAVCDWDAIVDHIAENNPAAAINAGDRIEEHAGRLADHPELGRAGRKQGTRELVITGLPYIAVYRYERERHRVVVLRILHGARQWPPNPA